MMHKLLSVITSGNEMFGEKCGHLKVLFREVVHTPHKATAHSQVRPHEACCNKHLDHMVHPPIMILIRTVEAWNGPQMAHVEGKLGICSRPSTMKRVLFCLYLYVLNTWDFRFWG